MSKFNTKKFIKIVFPCIGVLALVAGIYYTVIEYGLKDYQNLKYIRFKYLQTSDKEKNKVAPVTITKIEESSKYPSTFEVPSKILGHPVVEIGDEAFAGLTRLKKVILPKSVTRIGESVFRNCSSLTKVVVKGALDSVGSNIFDGCDKWEGFNTENDFIMFEDFLYQYNSSMKTNSILKDESLKGINESSDYNYVYLSSDVKSLCSSAFANVSNLVKVEMPARFTTIESSVFENCKDLREVVLNNVNVIKDNAFANCTNLAMVDISKIIEMGAGVFKGTAISNVQINDKLTLLNDSTFEGCSNIQSIILPSSVTKVGNRVFADCSSLHEITLTDSVTIIGVEAFKNTKLVNFKYPKFIKSIQRGTFSGVETLESIELPKVEIINNEGDPTDENNYTGITSIGDEAFKGTTKLKNINFPTGSIGYTLSAIGVRAFNESGLEEIIISNKIITLSNEAFMNCKNLTTVTFAENSRLEQINASCFKGTEKLEGLELPDSIKAIQSEAFSSSGINSIKLPNNPDFRTLNERLFENCVNLKEIVLPSTISTIRSGVFLGCDLTIYLESTNLPSGFREDWNLSIDSEDPEMRKECEYFLYSAEYKENCWHYDENHNIEVY